MFRSSRSYASVIGVVGCWLVLTPVGDHQAHAEDLWGVHDRGIGRDLGAVRGHLERAPRRAKYDLDIVRRRLWPSRIGAPLDPEAARLEREITRLEWQADRVLRRRALSQSLAALDAVRARLSVPAYLRPPLATDLRGAKWPIGVGKQIILIQSSLHRCASEIGRGEHGVAARHLADAETALDVLEAVQNAAIAAQDPQLVAARAQITLLKDRIGPPEPPG